MSVVSVTPQQMAEQNKLIQELYNIYSLASMNKGCPYTYNIQTFGCQLNESDSEKLAGVIEAMGLIPTEDDAADLVILNTCSIRENADDRLFGHLGILKTRKKMNKNMMIAVCGCMMKQPIHVEKIRKSYPHVDMVFGPQDIHRFPEILHAFQVSKKKSTEISDTDFLADNVYMPIARARTHRALVPIMYGCNNFCTYCVVPGARGRERSRLPEHIIEEIKSLVKDGYKEIVLLGQNVNSYGNDFEESLDTNHFAKLLKEVAEIPGLYRLRFMTSHPKDLTREVMDVMASHANIERHLHLPVQSGSNDVLRRMNRHYTREHYMDTVRYFRSVLPEATISTDIIVGFPGETKQDFSETLEVVRAARFDAAFTFHYSKRPGTPAAQMSDQIPKEVVGERFARLLDVQNTLCYESNALVEGTELELLVEGSSDTSADVYTGRSSENRLVNFTIPAGAILPGGTSMVVDSPPNGKSLEGSIAIVRIVKAKPFSCEGVLVHFCENIKKRSDIVDNRRKQTIADDNSRHGE